MRFGGVDRWGRIGNGGCVAETVPDDFTAFVTRYGARVARVCTEIIANDELARALQVDVLADVAARWSRSPGRSEKALVRLRRLLLREASGHPTATRAALDLAAGLGAEFKVQLGGEDS